MTDKVVGILGGGQLGRMLGASASLLNIPVVILSPGVDAPAKQVLSYPPSSPYAHIDGSFTDPVAIRELAEKVDVLTVEIEHVDVATLEEVQRTHPNLEIHPSPRTIQIIQDKFLQKEHLRSHGLPISHFVRVDDKTSIESATHDLGLPLMLKARTLAYDGRGNYVLEERSEIEDAFKALGGRQLYAEKWLPFVKEVAVMVVRSRDGKVKSYPVVETVHRDNICHLVFAGCGGLGRGVEERARKVAEDAVKTFQGAGVFGVEMFLMDDGSLYINEIAPRPHNSGHYTIEACLTSQYSNHLRAILALPLGSTSLMVPCAAMLNLIAQSSCPDELKHVVDVALTTPGATVHMYGKGESRNGRKMGHVTVVADSEAQLRERLRPLLIALPLTLPDSMEADLDTFCPLLKTRTHSHPFPLVGIIMGSDSDLPTMKAAASILSRFKIPFELTIVSAHRTPDRLVSYAKLAASRGLRCLVAGAGGAAHLPGMVASLTGLPVIGVPVKGSSLDGVDSLYSIVQMPRGIPVATVAINNSTNAGLLAVRILSAGMPRLIGEMESYLASLEDEVMGKVGKLEEVGWELYEVKR